MTPEERRRNSAGCFALAIDEIRHGRIMTGKSLPTEEEYPRYVPRIVPYEKGLTVYVAESAFPKEMTADQLVRLARSLLEQASTMMRRP